MRKGRWWLASVIGALAVVLGASVAMADSNFDFGEYTLTLPGIGEFEYTVASGESVVAASLPDGYEIDDDDPDKAAWKKAASLEVEAKEVEAKLDKVEGDYDWTGGPAVLTLFNGETITITRLAEGVFEVTTSSGLYAFGDESGSDWYVADGADLETADRIFKVEATEDGVEIKAVDGADDGFLNELDEEEESEAEEVEIEEEDDDDGEGKGRGRNPNN